MSLFTKSDVTSNYRLLIVSLLQIKAVRRMRKIRKKFSHFPLFSLAFSETKCQNSLERWNTKIKILSDMFINTEVFIQAIESV